MTHARIPDFSQPAPVRHAVRASAPAERTQRVPVSPAGAVVVIGADRPDTPHVRATRFLTATGEALTAVLIIAGGVFAYGFLPPA